MLKIVFLDAQTLGSDISLAPVSDLGDYVSVPTLYNGNVHGLIRSIELTIGKNKTVAKMKIREARPYV